MTVKSSTHFANVFNHVQWVLLHCDVFITALFCNNYFLLLCLEFALTCMCVPLLLPLLDVHTPHYQWWKGTTCPPTPVKKGPGIFLKRVTFDRQVDRGRDMCACGGGWAHACDESTQEFTPYSTQFHPWCHTQSSCSTCITLPWSCRTCLQIRGQRGGAHIGPSAMPLQSRWVQCLS